MFFLFGPELAAEAGGRSYAKRLIRAMSDPSFKVRLQAAILAGKKGITEAAGPLRRLLRDEKHVVRAAAAYSLARLGRQDARADIVRLMGEGDVLLVKAAEKALSLLDRKLGDPVYLVALEPVRPKSRRAKGVIGELLRIVDGKFRQNRAIVVSAGEHRVLSAERLRRHLSHRRLEGMLVKVKLSRFELGPRDGNTVVDGNVELLVMTLVNKRLEFSAGGEANAWIEGEDASESETGELVKSVLEGAAQAAVEQVLQYLAHREP
ncbi:MAG: HEAT repeat domain-containing protein [Deltaproteobacteria bacterium]|nr:MAG: HEAT repeat domain-containing protein [Deltaproteobacteria bacterium]